MTSLRLRSPFRPAAATGLMLALASLSFGAAAASPAPDAAASLLAKNGHVAVTSAGPFVAPGTFRVQVLAKLGRPDLTLADGTLLYHHRRIDASDATGTLVVRFNAGRVSSLALATPAVVTALRANPRALDATDLVAAR